MNKTNKLVHMVKYVLENNIIARDDDIILQKSIHYNEYRKRGLEYNLNNKNWIEYLEDIANNIISKPETIRRMRRKCQEIYPTTRGRKYESRQAKQIEVKKALRQEAERKIQEKTQTSIWGANN
jgi:hypothetical protein